MISIARSVFIRRIVQRGRGGSDPGIELGEIFLSVFFQVETTTLRQSLPQADRGACYSSDSRIDAIGAIGTFRHVEFEQG